MRLEEYSAHASKYEELGIFPEHLEFLPSLNTTFVSSVVKKQHLVDLGVFKQGDLSRKDTFAASNIDQDKLNHLGMRLAQVFGLEAEFADMHPSKCFDFSSRGECKEVYRVLGDHKAVVFPVGDALANPFWPQGLGLNQGMHIGLDAVHSIHMASQHQDWTCALQERYMSWKVGKWRTFGPGNLAEAQLWTSDPVTRYHREIYKESTWGCVIISIRLLDIHYFHTLLLYY